MRTFLLPCECSHRIVVGTAQAGGAVACPACGREVAVPKLRDFGQLQPADQGQSVSRGGWRPAHACMLAGGATALLAWVAALAIGIAPQSPISGDVIRDNVAKATDKQILDAWRSLSQSGVARPPMPEEKRFQQTVHFRRGVSRGLLLIGGVGAAVGLVGVALRASSLPRRS